MNGGEVDRDERTVAVENAGYRWSYLVLSFGLLALTAYRSLARDEAAWDLLALVLLGGAVHAAYQWRRGVLYRRWIAVTMATALVAGIVAAGIVALGGAG